MAQYCDSKVLEANWYNWLIASATPSLAEYRNCGLLLTRVISDSSEVGDPFWGQPQYPCRAHCLACAQPIFFNSRRDVINTPRYYRDGHWITCKLPDPTSALSDRVVAKQLQAGYVLEQSLDSSWTAMLYDLERMCAGISSKFTFNSLDDRDDLAGDALIQVICKIKNLKLVYTPGRAPVFNLLTTTIYRIIYSLLNKINRSKLDRAKHAALLAPFITKGQRRSRGRIVTRRIFGGLVASPLS